MHISQTVLLVEPISVYNFSRNKALCWYGWIWFSFWLFSTQT